MHSPIISETMFGQKTTSTIPTRGPNGDTAVANVPQDTVSSLNFGYLNNTNVLVSGSWSKDITAWTLDGNNVATKVAQTQSTAPVLTTAVDSAAKIIYYAGCDNKVSAWDIGSNQQLVIGEHAAPVKVIKHIPDMNILVSGGWDNTIKYWDVRQNTRTPVGQVQLPGKVYAMDALNRTLVACTENKKVALIDLNNPTVIAKATETPHELQTSSVSVFAGGGYATASIEGRVHIEYIGAKAADSFPFRCHRKTVTGAATESFSVTAVNFHPSTGILATAGGDGSFCFWDHMNKTRIKSFEAGDLPISCAAFNHDGSLYAYARSYNWMKGFNSPMREKEHHIYIHACKKEEVTPKK
jgi:mRNA export factor